MKIPDKAKTAFKGTMHSSAKVELPFPAPSFYIVNGNPQLAAIGGFQHFGGWACNVDKLKEAAEHWSNAPFPIAGLMNAEIYTNGNKKLAVLGGRSLLIAPIGMRQYSQLYEPTTGQTKRVAPFTPGARPGVQVLCLLGYKDANKVIQAWAPVLLTAKGYQVNHVQNAFAAWQKAIKPLLKQMLPDEDPSSISNLFWMSIGTFGTELKQDYVGTGQSKPITPVSAYIPEDLTVAILEKLYVGDDLAEFMADLADQASEWLKVFETMEPAKAAPSSQYAPEDPPPPDFDDNIPY